MPGALTGAGEAVNVVSGRVWRRPRRERQSCSTDEPVADSIPNTQPRFAPRSFNNLQRRVISLSNSGPAMGSRARLRGMSECWPQSCPKESLCVRSLFHPMGSLQ